MATQSWPPSAVARIDRRGFARLAAWVVLGAQSLFVLIMVIGGGTATVLWASFLNRGDGLMIDGSRLSAVSVVVLLGASIATLGSRLVSRRSPTELLGWLCLSWIAAAVAISVLDRIPGAFLATQVVIAAVGLWGCRLSLDARPR